METRKAAGPRIISGVIVLMISNIVVKLLGLLCKIPLHGLLGDQGMSYFNIAYNIFTTLYMVSTAGLPTAVTIMISDTPANSARKKQVERIFRVALSVFFVLGILGTAIMLFFAKPLAAMMGSDASYLCIMAISPTLFFICMSSAIRGYFQGHQNMVPTAVSEITEAIGKFAIGIALAGYSISIQDPDNIRYDVVAAYAITGITIGVAIGMLFLMISKALYRADQNTVYDEGSACTVSSRSDILKRLTKIALPITVSSVALNLTGIIDTFTIINCMKLYTTETNAEVFYGNYSTLAVTMSHLPSAFITPIASSLTPALTAALLAVKMAKTDTDKTVKKVRAAKVMQSCLKFAAMISIPCAIGMSVLSKPILSMLFNENSAESAAPLLSILSLSVFFTALLTITTSILQAHKLQKKTNYFHWWRHHCQNKIEFFIDFPRVYRYFRCANRNTGKLFYNGVYQFLFCHQICWASYQYYSKFRKAIVIGNFIIRFYGLGLPTDFFHGTSQHGNDFIDYRDRTDLFYLFISSTHIY